MTRSVTARSPDRLEENAKTTTADVNITRRRFFFIDVDPVRPADVCSTNEQHTEAHTTAATIRNFLREECGWPDPMVTDSGNGAALLYGIDDPNDQATKAVIDGCLAALADRFNTARIKIDTTVSNAVRIATAPGTKNRKGKDIPEQPHRDCRILQQPSPIISVTRAQLEELAEAAKAEDPDLPNAEYPANGYAVPFDVARWLPEHGVTIKSEKRWNDSELFILEKCPFNPNDHNRGEVHVERCPSGKLRFKCKHNNCQSYRWSDLRELLEPGYKDRRTLQSRGGQTGQHVNPPAVRTVQPTFNLFRFKPYTSADLFAVTRKHTWLIEDLLLRGEPAVIGGPRKCLKTSLVIDQAISLATGTPFLGYFRVPRPVKVAILSGESGEITVEQTVRRVCAARGIDPQSLACLWQFTLPSLANVTDLVELSAGLKREGVVVIILDPLYLFLLSGGVDADAANLFQTGPLLLAIAQACLDGGATPILVHHSTKSLKPGPAMQMEDLSFAGIAEFMRQWILLNRRTAFDPETGTSRLIMSTGGSGGHSGEYFVEITEGKLRNDMAGRRWDVVVTNAAEGYRMAKDQVSVERNRKAAQTAKDQDEKALAAIDKLTERRVAPTADGKLKDPPEEGPAPSKTQIRALARLSGDGVTFALTRLTEEGIVEQVEITTHSGKSKRTKKVELGYRRVKKAEAT